MPDDDPPEPGRPAPDALVRHNLQAEITFSAFNGVYTGLAILAAPVVAVTGLHASALELTVLVAAFPVGVFFGPLWAGLGRRVGMQRLVTRMAVGANLPLFLIAGVEASWPFTLLIAVSQVLNSAMRMGQSSLYHALYPRGLRGWVLGRLTFWTFVTLVLTILASGWLIDRSPEAYRVLYPVAGLCGLIGCRFYARLRLIEPLPAAPAGPGVGLARLRPAVRVVREDRPYLLFQAAFFLSGSAAFMSAHVVLILVHDRFAFNAFEMALWMSVVPQLLLAVSSPFWGPVLDRVGIVRCRLFVSVAMTGYLACYWLGVSTGLPLFLYAGSILQGLANGGGQLTWSLASASFAPRAEEVPLYTGIHFVLNGVRGLLLPWVGSVLWVLLGPGAVLAATLTSLGSIPIILRALRPDRLRPGLIGVADRRDERVP
jgi:MFS family permease